jgi:D-tyrosyl-tRNA(Tyr) deacylase
MRVVIQRVSQASVTVGGDLIGAIGSGLCLLVGISQGDAIGDVEAVADKIAGLRIFPDGEGRMNLSIQDVEGEALVVSQFTLLGEVRKGRRPSFTKAASPEQASPLIELLAERLSSLGVPTALGAFGAKMDVSLVNDGPVTILIETRQGSIL